MCPTCLHLKHLTFSKSRLGVEGAALPLPPYLSSCATDEKCATLQETKTVNQRAFLPPPLPLVRSSLGRFRPRLSAACTLAGARPSCAAVANLAADPTAFASRRDEKKCMQEACDLSTSPHLWGKQHIPLVFGISDQSFIICASAGANH